MGMIVCVIVPAPRLEPWIARLLPEDRAAREGDRGQCEAAEQHIEMKLLREQVLKHVRLPEPQAQTDDAERAREANHAELVDEVIVRFVVRMIVHGR